MQRFFLFLPLMFMASGCHATPDQAPAPGQARQQATPDARAADVARINQAVPDALVTGVPAPAKPVAGGKVAGDDAAPDPFLVRAQGLLARARFSPGVADGRWGTNLRHAIAAYQTAHGLTDSGTLDNATWQALLAQPGASRPVARSYAITDADVAGPFAANVGEDFVKLAALPTGPGFASPLEALSERFHMSQALMLSLIHI